MADSQKQNRGIHNKAVGRQVNTGCQYKHTRLFYAAPNKQKAKHVLKMGTGMLAQWIKRVTRQYNLAYFQPRLKPEIYPSCRL